MYDYIIGKVTNVNSTYIVLECGGIGYVINTPNPYSFNEGNEYKVYLYQLVREDELSLYGFKTIEEKQLFLKLISVKGLGPKMTLPILATGSVSGVIDAIERENLLYLKKFPKIGEKVAKQIILDLKGKLVMSEEDAGENDNELVLALESLGYKDKDIKNVIVKVDHSLNIESQIKEALKLLLK